MGQSFLTHDEKSSGSPSPDLIQFNGVSSARKFFGSLSSVKETSISGSSRSPLLESAESESEESRSRKSDASSTVSSSSRSPTNNDLYNSLVPTPILPGNVSRLREKFMDSGRQKEEGFSTDIGQNTIYKNENALRGGGGSGGGSENRGRILSGTSGAFSDPDCRYISRSATTSPGFGSRSSRSRRGACPSTVSTTRSRNSLYAISSASYRSSIIKSKTRTYPPSSSSAAAAYDEKLSGIRSDNDLSDCFRNQLSLDRSGSNNNMGNFRNATPLVRLHRPRTRPYVPPPRSVIIRAGYLPIVQTVDLIPTTGAGISGAGRAAASATASATPLMSPSERKEHTAVAGDDDRVDGRNDSVVTTARSTSALPQIRVKEDLRLVSSSSRTRTITTTKSPLAREKQKAHVVTNQVAHTEKKVLTKDAEVNTSAEVLVLPPGVKTSVLLKSGIIDEKSLKKRRKKRKTRPLKGISRVFGRIMIRFVEFF